MIRDLTWIVPRAVCVLPAAAPSHRVDSALLALQPDKVAFLGYMARPPRANEQNTHVISRSEDNRHDAEINFGVSRISTEFQREFCCTTGTVHGPVHAPFAGWF